MSAQHETGHGVIAFALWFCVALALAAVVVGVIDFLVFGRVSL